MIALAAILFPVSMDAKTPRQQLLSRLKKIQKKGVMVGMQDAPVYGTTWKWEEGRCDMKEVCGDYPAIMGFDLGKIEKGSNVNLDGVPFERMIREIKNQHKRGGIVTISWHPWNPSTGENAWDPTGDAVAASLPTGSKYAIFQSWLSTVAEFFRSLRDDKGRLIPVIFRPWHEMTGGWFWWGNKSCTPNQYKTFFRYTVDYMRDHGVNNIVWCYSPGADNNETEERYMTYYPGDNYVDMLGVDVYQFQPLVPYTQNVERECRLMQDLAKKHKKLYAITETGYRNTPQADWFTTALLPALKNFPVSYVLFWRNAWDQPEENFGPAPEKSCAEDFRKFYADKTTLFVKDIK